MFNAVFTLYYFSQNANRTILVKTRAEAESALKIHYQKNLKYKTNIRIIFVTHCHYYYFTFVMSL